MMNEEQKKDDKELLTEVPAIEIGEVLTEVEPDKGDLLTEVPVKGDVLIDEDPSLPQEGEFLTENLDVGDGVLNESHNFENTSITPTESVKPPRPKRQRPKKVVAAIHPDQALPRVKLPLVTKTKEDYTLAERKALKGNFSKRTLRARYGINL